MRPLIMAAALLPSVVTAHAQENSSEAMPASDPTWLDPITVSGELFERPIEDVTSSVTVRSGAELETRQIENFDQATRGVPNLGPPTTLGPPALRGLPSSGPGGDGGGGLATNINTGSLPRAPFIIDGIARVSSIADTSFRDLWDVESLEVYRGPQSTLRGRNAIAGAFVIETRDPTFQPEAAARARIEFDDFGGPVYRTSAVVSGGVVPDVMALRLAVDRDDGNIPLTLTGPRQSLNPDAGLTTDDQLDSETTRLRAKALILPPQIDALTINLLLDGHFGTVAGNRFTVADEPISGQPIEDRAYPFGTNGGQRVYDTSALTAAVDADYAIGNGLVVRSITSFAQDRVDTNDRQSDIIFFDVNERLFNQDVLLEIGDSTSQISGVLGVSFNLRWQDVDVDNIALPFADQTFTRSEEDSSSQALFGDLRYGIRENIDLLFGARLNRYRAEREQESFPASPGGPLPPPGAVTNELTEIRFLPKLGIAWSFAEGQSLAVTARRGYNPGGASVVLSTGEPYEFESESVWTFEATYRGTFWDDRLSLSTTPFFNLFEDPQLFLQDNVGGLASLQIINADAGLSYGAEIEGSLRISDRLTLDSGIGFLQTEITDAPNGSPELDGNEFGADPAVTLGVGITWEPLDDLILTARGSYVDEFASDVTNIPEERAGDFFLLDLGAGYTFGAVTGRVFVNNVTNEVAVTRRLPDSAGGPGVFNDLLPPRTFGIELSARF